MITEAILRGADPLRWYLQWPEDGTLYFRYCGHWAWFMDPPKCRPHVWLEPWRVVRRTPRGCWIADYYCPHKANQRFVLDGARKRFAYPTRAEAWDSFLIRQRKRLQHAKNQLEGVTTLLAHVEEMS